MAVYLEEFVESVDNLPAEIKHFLAEIRSRDDQIHDIRKKIHQQEKAYQNALNTKNVDLSVTSATTPDGPIPHPPKVDLNALSDKVNLSYVHAREVADEKIALAERAAELINKHMKRLDEQITLAASNVDENVLVTNLFESDSESRPQKRSSLSHPSRKKHKRPIPSSMLERGGTDDEDAGYEDDGVEPVYCICQQVSFGEMIACDNADKCPYEWFHLECVGLSEAPSDRWFCPICRKRQ